MLLAVLNLVLFMIVPHNLPGRYYAFHAIQNVHFIITLISLGPQNEHYNEVAVYIKFVDVVRQAADVRHPVDGVLPAAVYSGTSRVQHSELPGQWYASLSAVRLAGQRPTA